MICPNCQQPTNRMVIRAGFKGCAECWGMGATGGTKTDGILTRNSDRIRQQQLQYEGDTIPPHSFDKGSRKVVPNPDFVDRYPEQVSNYFTEGEIRKAGYSKADKLFNKQKATKENVTYRDPGAVIDPGKPTAPRKR